MVLEEEVVFIASAGEDVVAGAAIERVGMRDADEVILAAIAEHGGACRAVPAIVAGGMDTHEDAAGDRAVIDDGVLAATARPTSR